MNDEVIMECGCTVIGECQSDGSFEFHYMRQCPKHANALTMHTLLSKWVELIDLYGEDMDWGNMPLVEFVKTLHASEKVIALVNGGVR